MVRRVFALSALSLVILSTAASAGLIFNRHPKQPDNSQQQQAQDPISVLRNDTDERHRLSAVQSLSHTDLKQSPQAGVVLIDSMLKDPSPNVRAAAADALSKVRPMAVQIGMALEQAASSDTSPTVRNVADRSLAAYVHAGYHPSEDGPPPLAPPGPPPAKSSSSMYRPTWRPMLQSDEPPVAQPVPTFVIPPLSRGVEPTVPTPPVLVPTPPPADHDPFVPMPPPKIEMSPEPPKVSPPPQPTTDKSKDSKPANKPGDGPILIGPG